MHSTIILAISLVPLCYCSEYVDVIVVGAGISGLTAAKTLMTNNLSTIVLEAQNRHGGRIKTDSSSFSIPVEIGAQWIHGNVGNPITDILLNDVSNPNYFETDYDNSVYYDVDTRLGNTALDNIWSDFERIYNGVAKMQDTTNDDMPLSEAIQQLYDKYDYTQAQQRYTNFGWVDEVESEYATSCENMSMWWYDNDYTFPGSDWWIEGGYNQITDYLAEGVDIRLNTKVNSVDISNAVDVNNKYSIQITSADGSIFYSTYVIITVPLGILKKDIITFTPSLPTKVQHGIDHLYMGLLEKIFLFYDEVFWDKSVDFLYILSEGNSRYDLSRNLEFFNVDYYIPGSNLLCVFESGLSAYASETYTTSERLSNVLSRIRQVYPSSPDPTSYLITSWGQDQYTYGSYSSVGLGGSTSDRSAFTAGISAPDANYASLYFAGEHTAVRYPSTTSGAYISGEDAANRILGIYDSSNDDDYYEFTSTSWIIGYCFIIIFLILGAIGTILYCKHRHRGGSHKESFGI
jgi:monoamine oxidase